MGHRKYDEAFKRNTVQLVEGGQTVAQVARDLGLSPNQVYLWRTKYVRTPSTHGNALHNQDEMTVLKKELARTRMELDILKKAITIFSQYPEMKPDPLAQRLRRA